MGADLVHPTVITVGEVRMLHPWIWTGAAHRLDPQTEESSKTLPENDRKKSSGIKS